MIAPDPSVLATRLRHHVEVLAQTPRVPTTRAHRDAQDYIANHLHDGGFAVEEANFLTDGVPCTNILARMLPENAARPLVVIGAHYDSVRESPGADDNASAVAALLELARWIGPLLRSEGRSARLQLVAYDLEEYGFVGSELHCRGLESRNVDRSVGG